MFDVRLVQRGLVRSLGYLRRHDQGGSRVKNGDWCSEVSCHVELVVFDFSSCL